MVTIKNRVKERAGLGLIIFLTALFAAGCAPSGPKAFLKGKQLYEQGKYSEALEHFRRATSQLPTNAVAWHYLGLAAQHSGQHLEAERGYNRALTLNRDLLESRFALGCLLLDQNRADEAKAHFTSYNLRRGNNPEGLLKLGAAQLRTRESIGAERSFGEVLRLRPNHPEALNGLGLARLQRGRVTEAAQFFAAAVRGNPPYAPALLNLAIVRHQHLRDKPGALQAYTEYLRAEPAPPNAASVALIVSQLQQELAPQKPPPQTQPPPAQQPAANTNAVVAQQQTPPQVTQTPKVVAAEPALKVPPSPEPVLKQEALTKPARKATPPITVSQPPPKAPAPSQPAKKTEPAPKLENVQLSEEPAIHSARDESATPAAKAPEPSMAATSPPNTNPQVAARQKRGFLQTLNPLNLLGKDDKPKPQSYSAPGASAPPAPIGNIASESHRRQALERLTKTSRKYAYVNPPAPKRGNRANAQQAFARGSQAQSAGRLQDAIAAYEEATEQDPTFFEAFYNLGLAYSSSGSLTAALASYEQALAAAPKSSDARYNFAHALRQAGYTADAFRELNKVVANDPEEPRAHLALANLYSQQLNLPEAARIHYVKVLEIDPRHPQGTAIRYWLAGHQ